MVERPIFIPNPEIPPYVKEVSVEFSWYPGFSKAQTQKSIASLHNSAANLGITNVLEISSKSPNPLGVSLSAFNLMLEVQEGRRISVECAFQGSKVFEDGGPFTELYYRSSKIAKTDERLRTSGKLVTFDFFGTKFPLTPLTLFYDWLYMTALVQNKELAHKILAFQGFSDIAFNPKRSINCQARSAAFFVALCNMKQIINALQNKEHLAGLINGNSLDIYDSETVQQLSFCEVVHPPNKRIDPTPLARL